jgi:hypothetical protein
MVFTEKGKPRVTLGRKTTEPMKLYFCKRNAQQKYSAELVSRVAKGTRSYDYSFRASPTL